jgi:hypothetical protein
VPICHFAFVKLPATGTAHPHGQIADRKEGAPIRIEAARDVVHCIGTSEEKRPNLHLIVVFLRGTPLRRLQPCTPQFYVLTASDASHDLRSIFALELSLESRT